MAPLEAPARLAPGDRRAAILDAALGLAAVDGVGNLTPGAVAAAAGVTRPLVHHYFGGTRGLKVAVAEELSHRLPLAVRRDLVDLPVEEMVAANADAWLDRAAEQPGVIAGLLQPVGEPEVAAAIEAAREAIVDRMLANQLGTTDAPPAIRLLLRAFVGFALTATQEWLVRGRATRAEVRAVMVHGMLALMREAAPALLADPETA